jgi:hypothetical protein
LENYESDSLVEADKDTDVEAGVDPAAGVAKSRRRTRSTVAKEEEEEKGRIPSGRRYFNDFDASLAGG